MSLEKLPGESDFEFAVRVQEEWDRELSLQGVQPQPQPHEYESSAGPEIKVGGGTMGVEEWGDAMPCSWCEKPTHLEEACFLSNCDHFTCLSCLRAACDHAPSLLDVVCGATGCGKNVLCDDVRCALPDVFEHFTQKALEAAGLKIECPQCGNVFITEHGKAQETPVKVAKRVHREHFATYRFRCGVCSTIFCSSCKATPYHEGYTCMEYAAFKASKKCRFCGDSVGADGHCPKDECRDRMTKVCKKTHVCGHECCGIAGESVCLPCLYCGEKADDFCSICYVESLSAAPCVVACDAGHIFHLECLEHRLRSGCPTLRLSFGFAVCPSCHGDLTHPALQHLVRPIYELRKKVEDLAAARLKAEKESGDVERGLRMYSFYMCGRCKKPFCGGRVACGEGMEGDEDAARDDERRKDLLCPACCGSGGKDSKCVIHGDDFIQWKCRFCCKVATFFCGGTTHFCTECHRSGWERKNQPCEPCPGVGKCPFAPHAPNGVGDECEWCLGCAVCRVGH